MTFRTLGATINAFFVVLFLLNGQAYAASPSNPDFKAVAFDYFVIFDPNSVVPEVEKAFLGRELNLPKPGEANSWNTVSFARSRTIMKTFSR
jgi:2-haloacid dehalogenase